MTILETAILYQLRAHLHRTGTLLSGHETRLACDPADLYAHGYREALLAERVFLRELIKELEESTGVIA